MRAGSSGGAQCTLQRGPTNDIAIQEKLRLQVMFALWVIMGMVFSPDTIAKNAYVGLY
jgi:hypothetical protein